MRFGVALGLVGVDTALFFYVIFNQFMNMYSAGTTQEEVFSKPYSEARDSLQLK
jgi:hypothetical protein